MRPMRMPMLWLSSSPTRARLARFCTLSAVMASAISSVTAAVCLARKLTRIALRFFGFLAEPLQFVVQRFDGDPKNLRGTRLVVARMHERHFDETALRFVDRHAGRQSHRLNRWRRRSREIDGQMVGFNELSGAQ